MEYTTRSAKETHNLGKKLAKQLKGGEVLGLIGDLGAGKTTFTQGLAAGLSVKQKVTSPTFVLMKVYPTKHKTIKTLVHIDAYRIKTLADLEAIGASEYFNSKDSAVIIEWADLIAGLPQKKYLKISFGNADNQTRKITINK